MILALSPLAYVVTASDPTASAHYLVLPEATAEIPIAVPTWNEIRQIAIYMCGGLCSHDGCEAMPVTRSGAPRLEVVACNDGNYRAFCRSCRLRGDGAIRAAKGAETKRARRGHRRFAFSSDRAASTGKHTVLSLLHIEAIVLAHWGKARPTLIDIAASQTEVLMRRGYIAKGLI